MKLLFLVTWVNHIINAVNMSVQLFMASTHAAYFATPIEIVTNSKISMAANVNYAPKVVINLNKRK